MWRRIALPSATVPWAARPVVCGDLVAVGCSDDVPAEVVPVVAVCSLDGTRSFVIEHRGTGAWVVETSEPAIDDTGIVRAVVYEQRVALAVVAARSDGTELPRTAIPCEHESDGQPKLGTCIWACGDGGFVVSWEYRQTRDYYAGKFRSDGAQGPEWTAPEWIVGATRDAVVGYTVPARTPTPFDPLPMELVCRAQRDGRVLWRREGTFLDVGGTSSDAVLLVDREARYADGRARGQWSGEPTPVLLVDASSGRDVWRLDVKDHVFAAHLDGRHATILASDAAGTISMTCDDRTAALPIRRQPARGPTGSSSTAAPPDEHLTPVIVGHRIWADDTTLHAARPLALPASIAGFRRRIRDRSLTKADAVIASGNVYLRADDALWIAKLP